jgi:O-antigen/teichoic acid export membrane protein
MASEAVLGSVQSPSATAVRDAAYLVGGQLLSSVLLLATGIVLARALGPTGKGYYDIAVGSAMLLTTFTSLSLPSGIFFYAAKAPLQYRRLLLILAGVVLLVGLGVTAVLAGFGDTRLLSWMLPGGSRLTAAVLIGGLLVALQSQQFVQAVAKGRGKFKTFAASEVLARGATLAAAMALLIAGIVRPEAYVVGFGMATFAAVLLLTAVVVTTTAPTGGLPIRAMLLYSLPLFLGNVVQFMNYRIDIFFLKSFAGLAAVGTYMVAVWLAQIVWLVPNALASLILRTVAEREGTGAAIERVAAVTRACFALSVVTGLGLMLVGSLAITPVFGPEFRRGIPALLLLTPGTVLFCPTILLSAYLNGIQRQASTTWVACGALVVTLVLNFLLVPRLGIQWAAITSTCSYVVSTLATIYLVRRLNPGLTLAAILLPQPADLRLALGAIRAGAAHLRGLSWHNDRGRRTL